MYAILFFCMPGTCFASKPIKMELFTNAYYGVTQQSVAKHRNIALNVYDLDAPMRLEQALSIGMPKNPDEAKKLINAKIKNTSPDELKKAWQGIVMAAQYKLTKFPAIVVNNGEAVLYGVTNIDIANKHYQKWLLQ